MTRVAGVPLRHVFRVTSGGTPSNSRSEYWDGEILWITPEDLSDVVGYWLSNTRRKITDSGYESSGGTIAPSKAIVLSKRAPIGLLAVLAQPACSSQGCVLLSPKIKVDSRFYYYWLRSRVDDLQALGRGSTFTELSVSDLKSIRMPYPSIAEQRTVSDYLDRETARLDALVAEKERFLRILSEKRQALISRAVTCGLLRDSSLCDSDVPWPGKIPSHWSRCHLRRVLDRMDYGVSSRIGQSGHIAVLRMGDIQHGEIDYSGVGFVDKVDDALLLEPGDLVFNRTNSFDQIGKVALFRGNPEYPVSFASYLVRMRCGPSVLPEFLNWLLNSSFATYWSRAESLPAIGQVNLNPSRFSYFPILLPPLTEQVEIVSFLTRRCKIMDHLRDAIAHTIVLLKERRSALICSVIDGSIDFDISP